MYLPTLNALPRSQQTMDVFGGYNHNARIQENEFYDMKNLTSDYAPLLAPRKPRGVFLENGNIQGMIAKDALCWVDGANFVMNHYKIPMGLSTKPEDCPKQLISMGAYVIILPDKKYINTADITEYGSIEARFTSVNPVTFTLCRADGDAYAPAYAQPEAPQNPENMALWVDTSSVPNSLKQWSSTSGMWVSIATTYVKISSPGIGKAFAEYDGVFLQGLSGQLTDTAGGIMANTADLAALEGTAVIQSRGDDFIVVIGMLDVAKTITNPVTVSREMPAMDFVIERENRLWGCRYGLNNSGEVVNEIYCSKLGDFKNWNCFMGISTDSYVVSVGSDGPFTGAVTYGGYPLFFKENCVHKLFGDIPANFGIQTTSCRGVQQGSQRSLAIVNELLYYKARHAVCVYDGSLPVEISSVLGEERYQRAVAGAHGNKYYISMEKTPGTGHALFVYDTAKGIWHKEDDLAAYLWCSCGEEMYCALEDGTILAMLGSGENQEARVAWMAETGPIGISQPNTKKLSRLNIRMTLALGTEVSIRAQYDSVGQWVDLCYLTGTELRSFTIPVKPRRCDHFRLRFEGKGDARICSITKTITQGSDKV